ncbi:hypothetical protein G3A43_37795 [Paraburkholderia aspalathi]|nr:hypothetical protein [Paraburkholderia aspalathi]
MDLISGARSVQCATCRRQG